MAKSEAAKSQKGSRYEGKENRKGSHTPEFQRIDRSISSGITHAMAEQHRKGRGWK